MELKAEKLKAEIAISEYLAILIFVPLIKYWDRIADFIWNRIVNVRVLLK